MAKIYDITDRLSDENTVVLKVPNAELQVKIDSETVLKTLAMSDENMSVRDRYLGMQSVLFTKESSEKLTELNLPFSAYKLAVETAFTIAVGSYEGEETQGE